MVSHERPSLLDGILAFSTRINLSDRRNIKGRQCILGQSISVGSWSHLPPTRCLAWGGSRAHATGSHPPLYREKGALTQGQPLPVLWRGRTFCLQVSSKSQGSPVRGDILVSLTSAPSQLQRPPLQTHLFLPEGLQTLATLINSGSVINLIDREVAHQLGLGWEFLP